MPNIDSTSPPSPLHQSPVRVTPIASNPSPSPVFSLQVSTSVSFSHSITEKLDEKNLLLWEQQVEQLPLRTIPHHRHHFIFRRVHLLGSKKSPQFGRLIQGVGLWEVGLFDLGSEFDYYLSISLFEFLSVS